MKIKEDLMLRNVCGEWVIIPMGARLKEFNGIMKLNESGAFIWKLLEIQKSRDDIIAGLFDEYGLEQQEAAEEVDDFVNTLNKKHVLEGTW